jgi:hypothetical protein
MSKLYAAACDASQLQVGVKLRQYRLPTVDKAALGCDSAWELGRDSGLRSRLVDCIWKVTCQLCTATLLTAAPNCSMCMSNILTKLYAANSTDPDDIPKQVLHAVVNLLTTATGPPLLPLLHTDLN